jgi:hypothetical protein
MRPFDQHRRGRNNSGQHTSLTAWMPVFAAMAIMVTGCLSTFLVLQLDEFRPKLGDIVAFKPGSQDSDMWQMAIPATVVSTTGTSIGACTLDPNIMAERGGSLIVEGVQSSPTLQYKIHWSGARTNKDASSCGDEAELMVSRTDLQRLANAAGGFGVGDKGVFN